MKSLVCTSFGATPSMVIEEHPKPLPRSGYALIKMHAATVNQLSGQIRRGLFDKAKTPLVLSNDGAGTVEDSDLFQSGTRVAIYGLRKTVCNRNMCPSETAMFSHCLTRSVWMKVPRFLSIM